jgi:hypothetical protein
MLRKKALRNHKLIFKHDGLCRITGSISCVNKLNVVKIIGASFDKIVILKFDPLVIYSLVFRLIGPYSLRSCTGHKHFE